MSMKRRIILQALLMGSAAVPLLTHAAVPVIEVYKSASCGCCHMWVEHLKTAGLSVKVQDVEEPGTYRRKFGMPDALGSCHSARVAGYALEGHVPAADIRRLLLEKPKARGLAVPSMPLGSPGMEGPRSDPYDVFLMQVDGRYSVYRHYGAK